MPGMPGQEPAEPAKDEPKGVTLASEGPTPGSGLTRWLNPDTPPEVVELIHRTERGIAMAPVVERYEEPLPPASEFERYEQAVPGAGDRILRSLPFTSPASTLPAESSPAGSTPKPSSCRSRPPRADAASARSPAAAPTTSGGSWPPKGTALGVEADGAYVVTRTLANSASVIQVGAPLGVLLHSALNA